MDMQYSKYLTASRVILRTGVYLLGNYEKLFEIATAYSIVADSFVSSHMLYLSYMCHKHDNGHDWMPNFNKL